MNRAQSCAQAAAFLCLLPMAADSGDLTRYERWQKDRPMTQAVWYGDSPFAPGYGRDGKVAESPPPRTAFPDMQVFRRAGLNTLVDCTISNGGHDHYPSVGHAQAAAVPFMVRTPGDWGEPWNFGTFERFVSYLADDPAWSMLCGIQVTDEPHGEEGMTDAEAAATYGKRRDWIVENYPHLLVTAGEALGQPRDYLHPYHRRLYENIVNLIRPDVIIVQFYPCHWDVDDLRPIKGKVHPNFYVALDYLSEFCKTHRVGFWIYPQTSFRSAPYSDSTLRLEKFAALAYGATGFEDFLYSGNQQWTDHDPEQSYVVTYGDRQVPSTAFALHAQINREVGRLGNLLARMRHVRTYHFNKVPDWHSEESEVTESERKAGIEDAQWEAFRWRAHRFADSDDVRSGRLLNAACESDNLMAGFFRDADDCEYILLVNKNNHPKQRSLDASLARRVTLSFTPDVRFVHRIRRETGRPERLVCDDAHTLVVTIPGGTGDLFRLPDAS